MRIGIIGNGVVGNATGKAFEAHGHQVLYNDSRAERSTATQAEVVGTTDLCMVCLPTPQTRQDGLHCNTSFLDMFFSDHVGSQAHFVLRSTVPIGYTRQIAESCKLPNLIHWPEFLTARTAEKDALAPRRNLLGFPKPCWDAGEREEAIFNHPLLLMSEFMLSNTTVLESDETEFIKLAQNAFSAVKVATFNELRGVADKLGLSWDDCREALLNGGWINPMHTLVPGPDGKRGFGGACLPKDAANLADCIDRAFGDTEHSIMIKSALCRNKLIDRPEDGP